MPEPAGPSISSLTRYCAVFGHPVKHSASPAMQNAGIGALGLNWRYLAFDVNPDELRDAIAGARNMKFIGLNLTVPHKILAVEMMEELDGSALEWGAVNTVRFEARNRAGDWTPLREIPAEEAAGVRAHGFNTDADALFRALREDFEMNVAGASIVLLGAGGAGRVSALKLAAEGAGSLFLVNRTIEKAHALSDEIKKRFPGVKTHVGYPPDQIDLVLNATSLGLRSTDDLPLDQAQFRLAQARYVYDMIYRPIETALLRLAREAGCRTANGLSMLLHQGAKALEIWSGRPAPLTVMREALEKDIYGS